MTRLLNPHNFVAEKLSWHQCIVRDPTLSPSAKAVAGLVLHDLSTSEGGAWHGQESMAACLGFGVRQIRRLLEELEAAKYLQVEIRKGRGRTNIYRATLPDDAAVVPEKRTSTTAQTLKNRTLTTVQTPKNRTLASRKPDTGDRQSLYDPINRSPTPKGRTSGDRDGYLATVSPFAQADIRAAVMRLAGEGATVSYLDPAAWDADNNCIICASSIGFGRLRDLVGPPLAAKGVSIALAAQETRRIAA